MPDSPAARARASPNRTKPEPRRRSSNSRRSRSPDPELEPGRSATGRRGQRLSATGGSKSTKVPYRCSFCGKSQEQVRKLIAGQGVYICDEGINLCQEIIEEEMPEAPKAKPAVAKL